MQLRIHAPRLAVPGRTRLAIEQRVRLALGRHAAGIEQARLSLAPSPPGRDGGAAIRCSIRIRMRDGTRLAVEESDRDPKAAADAASWRLEHRLQRQRTAKTASLLAARRFVARQRAG